MRLPPGRPDVATPALQGRGGGAWDLAHDDGFGGVDPMAVALERRPDRIGEPDRRLLHAVLVDAIVRFRRPAASQPKARREHLEVERWLRSDDRTWPCSFVNVCETLGLAHEPLRRALLASRPRDGDGGSATRRDLVRMPAGVARRRRSIR